MARVDGTRLAEIIRAAQEDGWLRHRLFYCPEKVIEERALSAEESEALRFGDLSQVSLDAETRRLARRVFNEIPDSEGIPTETAGANVFALRGDPCL